jgi:hypothetical protein
MYQMNDITKHYRYQRLLVEAAQYRTLRQIFRSDPQLGAKTAAILREVFNADQDDAEYLHRIASA